MADSIADHYSILSAVFKAKADTKDGADGFSRKREIRAFFDFFEGPILLFRYLNYTKTPNCWLFWVTFY